MCRTLQVIIEFINVRETRSEVKQYEKRRFMFSSEFTECTKLGSDCFRAATKISRELNTDFV